jgi:hypothetical protein
MGINLQDLSDRDLFVRSFQLDDARSGEGDISYTDEVEREAREAETEIERRFGAGANDALADYFTVVKADRDDMISTAREYPERLVEIARGEHACDNSDLTVIGSQLRRGPGNPTGTGRRYIAQCWCQRTWFGTSDGRGWYDPTEGDDPTA